MIAVPVAVAKMKITVSIAYKSMWERLAMERYIAREKHSVGFRYVKPSDIL